MVDGVERVGSGVGRDHDGRGRGDRGGRERHGHRKGERDDRGDGQGRRLGYDLRRMTCKLFEHWADYRDGKISRAAFVRRMAPARPCRRAS